MILFGGITLRICRRAAQARCRECRKPSWPASDAARQKCMALHRVFVFSVFPLIIPDASMPARRRTAVRCQRAYAFLPGNDDARDNPESHLGDHKPDPVDALVEHRIHDSENAVNQTGPQDAAR